MAAARPLNAGSLRDFGERVGHVGLAGLDLFEPRLRALGARACRSRGSGPGTERQNRSGAAAIKPCAAKFVGEVARRSLSTPCTAEASTMAGTCSPPAGSAEVAVERAAAAGCDLDGFAGI